MIPLADKHADQIAGLLNKRNQLTVEYDRRRILESCNNYIYHLSETDDVVACVEVKMVQWYQAEVLHLTVDESQERKGHAKALLGETERMAQQMGARVLQCTIRIDTKASRRLFEGFGFQHVSTFLNAKSGNSVGVFQKVLVTAP